jgi:hypothetical protein
MALFGGRARYLNRLSGGLMIGAAALLALRQVEKHGDVEEIIGA